MLTVLPLHRRGGRDFGLALGHDHDGGTVGYGAEVRVRRDLEKGRFEDNIGGQKRPPIPWCSTSTIAIGGGWR